MKQNKQNISLLTMLMLVVAMLFPQWGWAQTATQPTRGSGTSDDPYLITKAEELAWFRDQVNGGKKTLCAKIADEVEEIDMSTVCHPADAAKNIAELSWEPIGNSFGNYFGGTFDGNGKTISNLYIKTNNEKVGFFGIVYGTIKNITFKNAKVENTGYDTGIAVGFSESSTSLQNIKTLSDCSVTNKKSRTGGIVGYSRGNISNCENYATVNGNEEVGGICGRFDSSKDAITSCANYGSVVGTDDYVGGIIGYFASGTVQDCANYGYIEGSNIIGGIAGLVDNCKIQNVLGYGDVYTINKNRGGIICGSNYGTTSGMLAYNSDAKLTYGSGDNKTELETIAFGSTQTSINVPTGYNSQLLNTGVATYLLQQNASEGAQWGQKLGTDLYPKIGSEDKVYPIGTVTLPCTGGLNGEFTNTRPAQEGTLKMLHTDNPAHHERVENTCTEKGNIEYWYCDLCKKNFADEQMTQDVADVVLAAPGHAYDSNGVCTRCHQEIPSVTLGNNVINIKEVKGDRTSITGYNLYKYIATDDGTLKVQTKSYADTYGSLWASLSASSYLTYNDDGDGSNFKFTYTVTKGTTYYIGVRQYSGNAIDGDVTLYITLNGIIIVLPEGLTGKGTEAEPYVVKTAEHLAWFRDLVNGGEGALCAKIADDVEVIDMSTVCHPADAANNVEELSWKPIGNSYSRYFGGTFDGNGKTISNLYIKTDEYYVGLFGYTSKGTIKNITFKNAKIENKTHYTGILAGNLNSTTTNIKTQSDCIVTGKSLTGGIAGNVDCNVSNCENHATVNGDGYTGGIIGSISSNPRSVTSCANYGAVNSTSQVVGGIIGNFSEGIIFKCANYGYINGPTNVGGIVGYCDKVTIQDVLGYGDVNISKKENNYLNGGIIIGRYNRSKAEGITVINSDAKLTYSEDESKTEISINDGGDKLLKANITIFTKAQLASGEATWTLNGSTATPAEGETLKWYQKLGDNADAYPVVIARGNNIVYKAALYACDGTTVMGEYANKPEGDRLSNHNYQMATAADSDGLYSEVCSACHASDASTKYIKDFCGEEGYNLRLTVEDDGTYKATEPVNISDAATYNSPVDFTAETLNYTRQYIEGNKWQAVYVPFDIEATAWTERGFTVVSINNFHEYETEEGKYTTALEVKKATSGTLAANTPYMVKIDAVATDADTDADTNGLTITIGNAKLHKAAAMTYYCMSMTRKYDFTGIYKSQTGFNADASSPVVYALSKQGELKRLSTTATLRAQRWYLAISDRYAASTASAAMPQYIGITMIGEGTTTGIEEIHVVSDEGNANATTTGIYDLQGRKLNAEPTHGIYIKNGKKYVK